MLRVTVSCTSNLTCIGLYCTFSGPLGLAIFTLGNLKPKNVQMSILLFWFKKETDCLIQSNVLFLQLERLFLVGLNAKNSLANLGESIYLPICGCQPPFQASNTYLLWHGGFFPLHNGTQADYSVVL